MNPPASSDLPTPKESIITPGFLTLHSHRTERLAHTVAAWLAANPLPPLQNEVVLVQSNGMGEWMKMALAQQAGVCMSAQVELPSRFLWRTYRQVLGAAQVPPDSPLDKLPMTWRLMRVLPTLLNEPAFEPLRRYVRVEVGGVQSVDGTMEGLAAAPQRLLQLCAQLADLFDQYQNHRPDWLTDWTHSEDSSQDGLRDAKGTLHPMPEGQGWQPLLWRAVLAELDDSERQAIRPLIHQQALAALRKGSLHAPVAPRVVVFGMSQMPHALLDMMVALGAHSQVMLAVPNPCQHDWSEVMDGREWWSSQKRRHGWKAEDLSLIDLDQMHLYAHPLLAAWGRSARDFIRQLGTVDDHLTAQEKFAVARLDLFTGHAATEDDPPHPTALQRIQIAIRDLEPAPTAPKPLTTETLKADHSLRFVQAHSPVRELEILHDHLLTMLDPAAPENRVSVQGSGGKLPPLQPRDIVVMLPNVETWAPAIRAVFGQFDRTDKRFIPFDIADLSLEAASPLVHLLDAVMTLPRQRVLLSDLADWIQLPAVAARLGLGDEQVTVALRWLSESGVRWGLHHAHREALGLGVCDDTNSLAFGIERLLLGYATGPQTEDVWAVAPFAAMGGLEAEVAGALAQLARTLDAWWNVATQPHTPAEWAEHALTLMNALLAPIDPIDTQVVQAMEQALSHWKKACEDARFDAAVSVDALHHGWHEALKMPAVNKRFRAGGVTFCTLMPMRAVPFEVVCLMGMNDGDYPRTSPGNDFDLMQTKGQLRAGDRSRQHDDRLLMLEALMSARRQLYISWQGRSERDNSEQPPSVLVSQLRDHVAACWGKEAVDAWTQMHPLQPFSRRYFEAGTTLKSHAKAWRQALANGKAMPSVPTQPPEPAQVAMPTTVASPKGVGPITLPLDRLQNFFKHPAKTHFREQLGVRLDLADDTPEDEETLALDGLLRHAVTQDWLTHRLPTLDAHSDVTTLAQGALTSRQRAGEWPLGGVGLWTRAQQAQTLRDLSTHWLRVCAELPIQLPRRALRWQSDDGRFALTADIDGWRQADAISPALCAQATASHWGKAVDKKKDSTLSADSQPHKLMRPWLHTLLVSATHDDAPATRWIAPDGVLHLPGLPRNAANDHLHAWMAAWAQGQGSPLPLPLKTAVAHLQKDAGKATYEGSDFAPGECDASWLRAYPTYEALTCVGDDGTENFATLAEELYGPMLAWALTITHEGEAA